MEQVLHGSARATPAVRRTIQASSDSLVKLAACYEPDSKTVVKWRNRPTTQDAPMGLKNPVFTVLSPLEEVATVTFRNARGCRSMTASTPCIRPSHFFQLSPALPLSAPRHQPPAGEISPRWTEKKKFKDYPLGYFHIDSAEVRTEGGQQYLFVAIDRTSKRVFAELYPEATTVRPADFWRRGVAEVPYTIHKLLNNNYLQLN